MLSTHVGSLCFLALPHVLWVLHHDNLGSRTKAHALDGGPWFTCSLDLKFLVLVSCRSERAVALFTLSQGETGQPRAEMTNNKCPSKTVLTPLPIASYPVFQSPTRCLCSFRVLTLWYQDKRGPVDAQWDFKCVYDPEGKDG